jgi:demethylmenaquinone methyltransferase/2-methoxy-6-polyprenyl-1,4-benzoquinol methylase
MAFGLKSADHLANPTAKRLFNISLFREVAPRYDFVTRALSLGRDSAWKRQLVDALPAAPDCACLDLACGTGDITFLLAQRYPRGTVIGADLTSAMLDRARAANRHDHVRFLERDMCDTGMGDASVDVVTGGYALRNAPDLGQALREIRRVLKPGGTAAFLDFSKPAHRRGQSATYAILKTWGGFWGLALHGAPEVYGYIAESLKHFPDRASLRGLLAREGFHDVRSAHFYCGMVELVTFRK